MSHEAKTHNNLVLVTGVSGSGKDYLLSKLADTDPKIGTEISVVNFGELLFSRISPAVPDSTLVNSRDDLNRAIPQDTVRILIESVIDEVIARQPAIINTHLVYRQNGSLQINPGIARRMAVKDYVYVYSDPNLISNRRANDAREREQEDPLDIGIHQQIALASTRILAGALGAGFLVLENRMDNTPRNVAKLQQVVSHLTS